MNTFGQRKGVCYYLLSEKTLMELEFFLRVLHVQTFLPTQEKPVSGVLESNRKDVGPRKEKDEQCTE